MMLLQWWLEHKKVPEGCVFGDDDSLHTVYMALIKMRKGYKFTLRLGSGLLYTPIWAGFETLEREG